MSIQTDHEIMLRVREGEVRQLSHLFDRHSAKLYGYYVRLTGDRRLSEDLVQEVFFRILKYRHTYRQGGAFTTWMYRIARNVRIDHFQKWRNESPPENRQDEPASSDPHPQQMMEAGEDLALLRDALAKLPDDKRELIILARFQDLKYDAIADILDVTVGVVKVRIHRAMKDLRELFFQLSGEQKR